MPYRQYRSHTTVTTILDNELMFWHLLYMGRSMVKCDLLRPGSGFHRQKYSFPPLSLHGPETAVVTSLPAWEQRWNKLIYRSFHQNLKALRNINGNNSTLPWFQFPMQSTRTWWICARKMWFSTSDLTHKGSISNILEEQDKNDLLEWIPRKDWNSQDN